MKKNVLKKFAAAALAAATVMSSMSVMAFAADVADAAAGTEKKVVLRLRSIWVILKLGIHSHQRIIQVWNQQERRKTYYKGLSLPM